MIDSTAPTGSSGDSVASFDFGTRTQPATSAAAMIGRLTRNTEPHQKCSSSRPDASGPSAAPLPEMPAQRAIALARSRAGNTLVRIDSVDGMTNAAPMPMIARATMSMLGAVGERAERRAGGEHHAGRPAARPCGRSGRRGRRR